MLCGPPSRISLNSHPTGMSWAHSSQGRRGPRGMVGTEIQREVSIQGAQRRKELRSHFRHTCLQDILRGGFAKSMGQLQFSFQTNPSPTPHPTCARQAPKAKVASGLVRGGASVLGAQAKTPSSPRSSPSPAGPGSARLGLASEGGHSAPARLSGGW